MRRTTIRGWIALVVLICVATLAVTWMVTQETRLGRQTEALSTGDRAQWAFLTSSWTPESDEQRREPIFIDKGILASGGLSLTRKSMSSPHDPESLSELRDAIESRGRSALARRRTELESLRSPKQQLVSAIRLNYEIAMLSTYEG